MAHHRDTSIQHGTNSSWLEYSAIENAALCFAFCRFTENSACSGENIFTRRGYKNWEKASDSDSEWKFHNRSVAYKDSTVVWESYKYRNSNEILF